MEIHLADRPGLLHAVIEVADGGQELRVYRSVIVRSSDALYRPVQELLDGHCTNEISSATVTDAGMMFRKAKRTTHMLWSECPTSHHRCVVVPLQREEGECPTTGPSVRETNMTSADTPTISAA